MNAAGINYFPKHIAGEGPVTDWYKRLAKMYHPDVAGGDSEIMQIIVEQFNAIKKNNWQRLPAESAKQNIPFPETPPVKFHVEFDGKKYDLRNEDDLLQGLFDVIKKRMKG